MCCFQPLRLLMCEPCSQAARLHLDAPVYNLSAWGAPRQECFPYIARRLLTDNHPRTRRALHQLLYAVCRTLLPPKVISFAVECSPQST